MSGFKLIGHSIKLIFNHKIIIVPYLIFFFITQIIHVLHPKLITQFNSPLLYWIGIGWILDLALKSITIYLSINALNGTPMVSYKEMFSQYFNVILATIPFSLPVIFALHKTAALQSPQALEQHPWVLLGLIAFILPLSLIAELIPVIGISEKKSVVGIILHTVKFIQRQFTRIIIFIVLLFAIAGLFMMIFLSVESVPLIGTSVLQVISQAGVKALYIVMTTTLYFTLQYPKVEASV